MRSWWSAGSSSLVEHSPGEAGLLHGIGVDLAVGVDEAGFLQHLGGGPADDGGVEAGVVRGFGPVEGRRFVEITGDEDRRAIFADRFDLGEHRLHLRTRGRRTPPSRPLLGGVDERGVGVGDLQQLVGLVRGVGEVGVEEPEPFARRKFDVAPHFLGVEPTSL